MPISVGQTFCCWIPSRLRSPCPLYDNTRLTRPAAGFARPVVLDQGITTNIWDCGAADKQNVDAFEVLEASDEPVTTPGNGNGRDPLGSDRSILRPAGRLRTGSDILAFARRTCVRCERCSSGEVQVSECGPLAMREAGAGDLLARPDADPHCRRSYYARRPSPRRWRDKHQSARSEHRLKRG